MNTEKYSNEHTSLQTRKNKKSRSHELHNYDVIYPILLECASQTKDGFWSRFYQDLSKGKSTKGIYISNGTIQTSNKRNGFSYCIIDKAPEVIISELHHLLTTHTSICSKEDLLKRKIIIKEIEDEFDEYDKGQWTQIKRKNIKLMLIIEYILRLKKKYDLNWNETINGLQTINLALENKTHTSKDINYKRGRIYSINDIELSSDNKTFINLRLSTIKDDKSLTNDTNPIILQSFWDNYLTAWIRYIKNKI